MSFEIIIELIARLITVFVIKYLYIFSEFLNTNTGPKEKLLSSPKPIFASLAPSLVGAREALNQV